jgi:hypothetical protein
MEDLLDAILRRKAEIAQSLASGAAADFAAYRELVGQVAGLTYAQEQLEAILRGNEE